MLFGAALVFLAIYLVVRGEKASKPVPDKV